MQVTKLSQYHPVLMEGDVAEISAFYQAHFGFQSLFESDWYVHLQPVDDENANLAILDGDSEAIPAAS